MLVKVERQCFQKLYDSLAESLGRELVDEAALPSYLHRNPLIPWIVWRRLATVLELVKDEALEGRVLRFLPFHYLPTLFVVASFRKKR